MTSENDLNRIEHLEKVSQIIWEKAYKDDRDQRKSILKRLFSANEQISMQRILLDTY